METGDRLSRALKETGVLQVWPMLKDAASIEADEANNPLNIRLLRPDAVMPEPYHCSYLIEKFGLLQRN